MVEATSRGEGLTKVGCLEPSSGTAPASVPVAMEAQGASRGVAAPIKVVAGQRRAALQTQGPMDIRAVARAGRRLGAKTTRRLVQPVLLDLG